MTKALLLVAPLGTHRRCFLPAPTWHHVDDYDPTTNTGTMELVQTSVHGRHGHVGGVRQWERATGRTYR
jgi:hypothetical protein